jgi:hypothetical protein
VILKICKTIRLISLREGMPPIGASRWYDDYKCCGLTKPWPTPSLCVLHDFVDRSSPVGSDRATLSAATSTWSLFIRNQKMDQPAVEYVGDPSQTQPTLLSLIQLVRTIQCQLSSVISILDEGEEWSLYFWQRYVVLFRMLFYTIVFLSSLKCDCRNLLNTFARFRDPLNVAKSHRNPFETVRKYSGVLLSVCSSNFPIALFKFSKPLQASTRPLSEKGKSHRISVFDSGSGLGIWNAPDDAVD